MYHCRVSNAPEFFDMKNNLGVILFMLAAIEQRKLLDDFNLPQNKKKSPLIPEQQLCFMGWQKS